MVTSSQQNAFAADRLNDRSVSDRRRKSLRLAVRGLSVFTLLAGWDTATARSQGARSGRDSVRKDTLSTVVVTVLRTRFDLFRAPMAISAAESLEIRVARLGLSLDETLRSIPGVQVDNRFNFALGERISVRGFGGRAQFGVRGIRVLLDEIPLTLPDGQTNLNNVDPGLLGRAEVIRGPAASLYGNASGGVIQLHSAPAPAQPFAQTFRFAGGSNGMRRAESVTGGTLGSTSYGLTASRLDYAGYRSFNSAHNAHLGGSVAFEGERDVLRLIGNWVEYRAANPGGLTDSMLFADRTQAVPFNVQQQTGERGRQGQYGLTWHHVVPVGELQLSAYGLERRLDNPIPPRIIALDRWSGGTRAAFASTPRLFGAPVQLIVGGEGALQRDDRQNFTNSSGSRGPLVLNQLEWVRTLAGFGQASTTIGNRTTLLAGLRYDRFRFTVNDRLTSETNPDDSGERIMEATSPSVGITFHASNRFQLYGNFATAFETPTTTELANRPEGAGGFNPLLEPQHTRSFEAGLKGQLARWGVYQIALYHARIENSLVPFEVPGTPGRQFFRNAGESTHRGGEGSITLVLADAVLARAAYTYVDARFDRYTVGTTSYADNRVPGIAPHHVTAGVSYAPLNGALVAFEARGAGRVFVDDANLRQSPGYLVFDARGQLPSIGRTRVSPFVGVTNIFDTKYNSSVIINANAQRYFEPAPLREFYLGLEAVLGRR
jgi:iron complex outermembrane recepter protein